jgi:hypothetical protein
MSSEGAKPYTCKFFLCLFVLHRISIQYTCCQAPLACQNLGKLLLFQTNLCVLLVLVPTYTHFCVYIMCLLVSGPTNTQFLREYHVSVAYSCPLLTSVFTLSLFVHRSMACFCYRAIGCCCCSLQALLSSSLCAWSPPPHSTAAQVFIPLWGPK